MDTGTDAPDPGAILQLGLGFWASKTLLSAIELGVFTELAASGPLGLDELSARVGVHPRAARDFFDALVALHMLDRADGRYANTRDTDVFLDRNKPTYAAGMLEMSNARLFRFWNDLTDGLRTGLPQNEIKTGDAPLFDAIYHDDAALRRFLRAMSGISGGSAHAIAAGFRSTAIRPSSTSAARRGVFPSRSPGRIRMCAAAASTCPRSGRCSTSSWPPRVFRTGWRSSPAISSSTRYRVPTC